MSGDLTDIQQQCKGFFFYTALGDYQSAKTTDNVAYETEQATPDICNVHMTWQTESMNREKHLHRANICFPKFNKYLAA